MRTLAEEQRDNLNGYLKAKKEGWEYADFFSECDDVVIYGFGDIGRLLYHELKNKRNVVCALDISATNERFYSLPVLSPYSEEAREMLKKHPSAKVIVTPTLHFDEIKHLLNSMSSQIVVYPFCVVTAFLEIRHCLPKDKQDMLLKLIVGGVGDVKNVVLVNSMYSLLIYMLYCDSFKNTIVFTHSFDVSKALASYIEEAGGTWLPIGGCAKGGFYDVNELSETVRAIKYYCKENDVNVFSQDFFEVLKL